MYYVYVLKSRLDGKLYYGQTQDLDNRLNEHNSGKVKSTAGRTPLDLTYYEVRNTREEALKREKFFKSGFGRMYLKQKLKSH
jgi:putative endonuclease